MNNIDINVYVLKYLNSIYVEGKTNSKGELTFYYLPYESSSDRKMSLIDNNIVNGKRENVYNKIVVKDDNKYNINYVLIDLKLELKELSTNQKLIPICGLNKNKTDIFSFPYIELLMNSNTEYNLKVSKMLKDFYEKENINLELYIKTLFSRMHSDIVATNIKSKEDFLRYVLNENKKIKLFYKYNDELKELINIVWGNN